MRIILNYLKLICFFIVIPSTLYAAQPLLYFSDIINGPKAGLGDSLGEGAIVTLWGKNLGTEMGGSKVYFKDAQNTVREMAYVYYWENADPGTGLSGPSDMYTYHKMQEIACSIPSASADGAGKIYVEVNGIVSNELDFYARSSGRFYFIDATSGSDAASGSWANPRATLSTLTRNDSGLSAGDIIYAKGNYSMSSSNGLFIGNSGAAISGSENNHIAISVYPGASLSIEATGYRLGINNYSSKNNYWVISKVEAFSARGGTVGFANGRLVGLDLHGRPGVTPEGAAALIDAGANFAVSTGVNNIDNLKVFGNYLHDFGTPASNNNLLHTMYFRIRSNTRTLRAPEIAWNYLHDKDGPRFGIHYYDEGSDSDGEPDVGTFIDTLKIHDNVVREQTGPGINIGTLGNGSNAADFNVDIYNNLLIECGKNSVLSGSNTQALQVYGTRMTGHFNIFNNTIIGYGEPSKNEGLAINIPITNSLGVAAIFGGTYSLKNNIFIDTNDLPFYDSSNLKDPVSSDANCWYSAFDNSPPPIYAGSMVVNPNLSEDYKPLTGSSVIDSGADTSTIVTRDILGVSRPSGKIDIGAYEFDSDAPLIDSPKNLRIEEQEQE